MFASFFPRPKLFLLSILIWATIGTAIWFVAGAEMGQALGFALPADDAEPVIGLGFFITADFIWFYIYYALMVGCLRRFGLNFPPTAGNIGRF